MNPAVFGRGARWLYLYLYVIVALVQLQVSGCFASPQDQIYTAFKCGKVAVLLGRTADAQAALRSDLVQVGEVRPELNCSSSNWKCWIGSSAGAALHSAVNGHLIYHTHVENIDFAEALHHVRVLACRP